MIISNLTGDIYLNLDNEKLTLDENQRELLQIACKTMLTHTKAVNNHLSSYSLKNYFNHFLGFYISDEDMKLALFQAGFISLFAQNLEMEKSWHGHYSSKSPIFRVHEPDLFGKALKKYLKEEEE